jgi:hypothetical protein
MTNVIRDRYEDAPREFFTQGLGDKKFRACDQFRAIAGQGVADGDTAFNPVHREFGHRSCRTDRKGPLCQTSDFPCLSFYVRRLGRSGSLRPKRAIRRARSLALTHVTISTLRLARERRDASQTAMTAVARPADLTW